MVAMWQKRPAKTPAFNWLLTILCCVLCPQTSFATSFAQCDFCLVTLALYTYSNHVRVSRVIFVEMSCKQLLHRILPLELPAQQVLNFIRKQRLKKRTVKTRRILALLGQGADTVLIKLCGCVLLTESQPRLTSGGRRLDFICFCADEKDIFGLNNKPKSISA